MITIHCVRTHFFVLISVSPTACGPKFLLGSSCTGPLRRGYHEGAGAIRLVSADSRLRASYNPSAGHRHFYSNLRVTTFKDSTRHLWE